LQIADDGQGVHVIFEQSVSTGSVIEESVIVSPADLNRYLLARAQTQSLIIAVAFGVGL
jgi:hypothetical protein